MTERPILFSAPMVRALLSGTKTQTRRIVKPQPDEKLCGQEFPIQLLGRGYNPAIIGKWLWPTDVGEFCGFCPYGVPSDSLWVREAWSPEWSWRNEKPRDIIPCAPVWYWADGDPQDRDYTKPKPSIHMPRWASRITLKITDVRVERLNDISEADARAEGLQLQGGRDWPEYRGSDDLPWRFEFPRDAYRDIWEQINGPNSWDANPWVWAVSFEVTSEKA